MAGQAPHLCCWLVLWFCGFLFVFFVLFCCPLDLHASPTKRKHTPFPLGLLRRAQGALASSGGVQGCSGALQGRPCLHTPSPQPAPPLSCVTSSNPHTHPLYPLSCLPGAPGPPLLPLSPSTMSLPQQRPLPSPGPAPAFPEGHPVWPPPLGLPPRPLRSSTHPTPAVASLQPQGLAPREEEPPRTHLWGSPTPQPLPQTPIPTGGWGAPPQAAKHDFGKSF